MFKLGIQIPSPVAQKQQCQTKKKKKRILNKEALNVLQLNTNILH